MSNKDTKARITTYVEYAARVQKEWVILNAKYFPNRKLDLPPSYAEAMKVADKYKSRGQWTPHGGQAKFMALEPDTVEVDAKGKPVTGELDYDAFYFWTSQYVHATIHSLYGHAIECGDQFRARARTLEERDLARLALFITISSLIKIFIQACRRMREEQPEAILQNLFKMMHRFVKRQPSEP